MTDLETLERVALMANTSNHWRDDMRLMPADGVADVVYDAVIEIADLREKLALAEMELPSPRVPAGVVWAGVILCGLGLMAMGWM